VARVDRDGTEPPDAAGARLDDLVRVLVVHWPAVLAALEPDDRDRLQELVDGIGRLDPDRVLEELAFLLTGADLPADHEVMSLVVGRPRLVATRERTPDVQAALDRLAGALRAGPAAVVSVAGEPVTAGTVRRRLAGMPAYGPEDVEDAADLIRLRVGGRVQLPRFQFRADRAPDSVVLEVNRLLDAEADPWGVASWWVDQHAWLRGTPADLLAGTPEQRQRVAAAAEAEVAD
jgi:hypothetical protein